MNESEQPIYEGMIITLERRTVRLPNGAEALFEFVRHPGGAAVVAINQHKEVCLLRQYRPAVEQWLWELPAGKRDHGEAAEQTARRELEEEAGVRAGRWTALGGMISSPGVFDERVELFLARDLTPTATSPEHHEVFELHWIPWGQALEWATKGKIQDAKTVIGLWRAETQLPTETGVGSE